MSAWFVSDIHLTDTHERNSNLLLRFLFYLNQNPKVHQLFLLGDIFDLWVGTGSAFETHFKLIIDQISLFKKNGGVVYYFEGNHDFHVDVFWTKKLGIPVIENDLTLNIEGLVVRMEHGDFINPNDHKYLNYRQKIRRPLSEALIHLFPSCLVKYVGENQSKKSRKRSSSYAVLNKDFLVNLIREYAGVKAQTENFDLIVTGHMHVFDQYEFTKGSKKVTSINLGTWLDKPRVLKLSDKNIEVLAIEKII